MCVCWMWVEVTTVQVNSVVVLGMLLLICEMQHSWWGVAEIFIKAFWKPKGKEERKVIEVFESDNQS